jgi:hypothetical protein
MRKRSRKKALDSLDRPVKHPRSRARAVDTGRRPTSRRRIDAPAPKALDDGAGSAASLPRRGRGRPRLPDSERLSRQVSIGLTEAEWLAAKRVAHAQGLKVGALVRMQWRSR